MKENQRIATTTGSAIGLSTLASVIGLCCVGPWTVAVLGVSGAVAMARWQPYRPYILTLAAILLLWAFWRVYRAQAVCTDDRCVNRSLPWLKRFLWLAAVMLVLAFSMDHLQWLMIDPTPEGLRHD